jgi:glucoamylase
MGMSSKLPDSIFSHQKGNTWLALGATVPFKHLSCGYVGQSDGWTDLADNFQMDWEFDSTIDGNISLTGELDLDDTKEFTLGLAFGNSLHNAISTLFQSLNIPFPQQHAYYTQWQRSHAKIRSLEHISGDDGHLYHHSVSLLLAHEDSL